MKRGKSTDLVLGVTATNRLVHAVLLGPGLDGEREILRSFTRQRGGHGAPGAGGFPGGTGGFGEEATPGDFSIQFGEGGGGNDLFLSSEFSGLDSASQGDTPMQVAEGFEIELGDILAECRDSGYENPLVAFCMGSVDVAHVELIIPVEDKNDKKRKAKSKKDDDKAEDRAPVARAAAIPDRARLLAYLGEQYNGEINEEQVSFLPMTPTEDGLARVLAVLAKPGDPYVLTLKGLRSRQGQRPPAVRLTDTEVSLYLGLARAALSRSEEIYGEDGEKAATVVAEDIPQSTLVVRVGAEDTLVMFLDGKTLHHHESLRSLTAYDAPETVCSRVLLQQDEHGIGDVHNVLLLSQEREDDLVASFEIFFPGAHVASLRQHMPQGVRPKAKDNINGTAVPAIAAALRVSGPEVYHDVFENVNLLPKGLTRRGFSLPYTWHSLVVAVLLFCTTLFFVARFFSMESEIGEYREKLKGQSVEMAEANARVLQTRIDSMKAAYNGYMNALSVVDSLLVGSDRWSRALEKLSDETAAVQGIWVEKWSPQGSRIEIAGNATSRDRVVYLAERLKGDIRDLTFSEIREWPVYTFTMQVPVPSQLPEAAKYFREQVAQADQQKEASNTDVVTSGAPPVSEASLQDN